MSRLSNAIAQVSADTVDEYWNERGCHETELRLEEAMYRSEPFEAPVNTTVSTPANGLIVTHGSVTPLCARNSDETGSSYSNVSGD